MINIQIYNYLSVVLTVSEGKECIYVYPLYIPYEYYKQPVS